MTAARGARATRVEGGTAARAVTRASLARMPLPHPDAAGDKDARGRVLAVGGSASVPGAILLAGVAALRAGAGKLQLATVASVASVAPALGPHAGEMASLLGMPKEAVEESPADVAREAARRFGAVVALKGAVSWIATPEGVLHRYSEGTVGLATSGSGDTLAGIVAGLAARGASAECAAVWGAFLHGAAGRVLARRLGPIGFLARELLDEVPRLLHTTPR